MTNKHYRFFNWPVIYEKEDYDTSKKRIIERYRDVQGLLSIYEWGSVSSPGISDIDIVLVYHDMTKSLPIYKRSFFAADKKTRYLAYHPFIHIQEKDFKNVEYIYKNTKFICLYGNNVEREHLSEKEALFVDRATINDIIIRHYPRDFVMQEAGKRINVRDTLLRLNSLKYTISILEKLSKEKIHGAKDLIAEVSKLRTEWFSNKDTKLLARLNSEAIDLTLEIIDVFEKVVEKQVKIRDNQGKIEYLGIKNRSQFVPDWKKDKAHEQMMQLAGKNRYTSILPVSLAAQLAEYSRHEGPISNHIRSKLRDGSTRIENHQFKEVLKKRIEILNNQASLAATLKHSDFTAFFDFGYRNKKGINNWIVNALDKVKY